MLSKFSTRFQATTICQRLTTNMALYNTSVLKSTIKAMGRSLRASLAPVSLPTGHQRLRSLRRQLSKLHYESSSSVKCVVSAMADTARNLACCGRPAVTENWEHGLGLGAKENDNQNGYEKQQTVSDLQSPHPIISANEKQALLAAVKLACHRQLEANAALAEPSPDITAHCFEDDASQVEADKPKLTSNFEDMPLPLPCTAQQQPANTAENDLTWQMMVAATADFAALPTDEGAREALGEEQTSSLFATDIELELQYQERRQAIELRAAAAAAQGAQPISSEEKRALRAAGQATRQAAAAELAAQLKKTDADLQKLTDPEKSAWFEEHARPTIAEKLCEPPKEEDADDWNDPDILALVAGLKRLNGN